MGFLHNLFWRNHDAEIAGLKSNLDIISNNYQESLSKNAVQMLENERLREGLEQAQKTFLDHTLQCNEAAENAEKLVGTSTDFSEQALQLSEMTENANMEWIITAVAITAFVCTAVFIALCIYQGMKQEREENKGLLPETGISSSRTSSVSNLMQETAV